MTPSLAHRPAARRPQARTGPRRLRARLARWSRLALAVAAALPAASHAIDFGPFSLNGFAKLEFSRTANNCPDCARFPAEDKQRFWADELVPGREFKTRESHVTLVQPYLGAKFDLGKGFKLSGLVSQRWRDGKQDIPGFWYDKNIALTHEDYGSLRIGSMTTRAWSMADYPFGTNIGVADVWGSSGAGYGLLTHAARYTARTLDVLDGDLVLEATYDYGNSDFKRNKPRFWEFYGQYHRGDLVVDAMVQDSRNGTPAAWGHGPFTGLTPFATDDPKLGSSGQSIAMVMARYQINTKLELSAGLRRNRWSGAYAAITDFRDGNALWNNMFNVDWSHDLGGGIFRGYPATSTDGVVGLRYRLGAWTAHTGMAYLGKASTANPVERGQSNSMLVNTLGLSRDLGNGFQVYGSANLVRYGRLGLSPLSVPGNSAFTNVDSRVNRSGNWFVLGGVFVF